MNRLREQPQTKKAAKQPDLAKQKLPTEGREPSKREQNRLDYKLLDAAKEGDDKKIRELLKAGAAINAKDSGGETALMVAAMYGHMKACLLLIGKGANIEARNSEGWTALHWAAFSDVRTCAPLLENGAAINAKDSGGNTPLMYAEFQANTETAELLRLYSIRKLLGVEEADRFVSVFNECIGGG